MCQKSISTSLFSFHFCCNDSSYSLPQKIQAVEIEVATQALKPRLTNLPSLSISLAKRNYFSFGDLAVFLSWLEEAGLESDFADFSVFSLFSDFSDFSDLSEPSDFELSPPDVFFP